MRERVDARVRDHDFTWRARIASTQHVVEHEEADTDQQEIQQRLAQRPAYQGGVYQMGDVYARSWMLAGTSFGSAIP